MSYASKTGTWRCKARIAPIFVDRWRFNANLDVIDRRRTAMTIKTLAAAVALTVIPAMGFAYECSQSKQKQASMTCAEGSVYDAQAGACVPTTG
jgi:hypothetical protein